MRTKVTRDKKWIGAAIGALAGLIGAGVSANSAKNAAEVQQEQWEKNQINQNRRDAYNQANALTNAYGNQEYVDEYNRKLTYRCGGRRKASGGVKMDWSALASGIGTIGSAIIAADATNYNTDLQRKRNEAIDDLNSYSSNNDIVRRSLKRPSYAIDASGYNDRLQFQSMYRCGGKRKR